MNPRKRRLLKLKALEAKKAAAAPAPAPKVEPKADSKPAVKKVKETKPASKRKPRKTSTKKEE